MKNVIKTIVISIALIGCKVSIVIYDETGLLDQKRILRSDSTVSKVYYYTMNGTCDRIAHFNRNGLTNGWDREYENDTLKCKTLHRNGREKKIYYYYKNGDLNGYYECEQAGSLKGKFIKYHPNGKIMENYMEVFMN
jgi:antitoxin component YwqK of YwqJK toxin-antitoxin module